MPNLTKQQLIFSALRARRGVLAALVAGAFLLSACGPSGPAALPDQAVVSTPIAALPINVVQQGQNFTTPTAVPQMIIDAADAEHQLLVNVYERVAPSVVNVDVTLATTDSLFNQNGGSASGSGIVYDTRGHIITNAHVVAGAAGILITFNDGYVTAAEIVGEDSYSDLAVLRVNSDRAQLNPVIFGNSDQVRVGERAIAIGNPFGLASSMTVGVVSGLGRQLPSADLLDGLLAGFQNPSIIQVDADINPGNSGGPLLNSRGELIGVNTAIRTESGVFQGVGFAVPSRTVQRVIPELIANGRVDYAWIGITALPSELGFGVAALAEPLDLPVTSGVLIDQVTAGSPAQRAGLRGGERIDNIRGQTVCVGGDIIVAVNGDFIANMDALISYLVVNTRPGDTVDVLVVRGDQTFEVPVTLESRPTSPIESVPCR
ncbi:MAG: PDZ domain-containing protein [Chloroflexi bacterium]|nr:PDZ domain-containing protein [Chloroflexota bacterium]